MSNTSKSIPDGFHTITPYLVIKGASDAIEFYKKAFGAQELTRSLDERSGRVMNAKLRIGDSIFMLNDEYPEFGCFAPAQDNKPAVSIHLYVEDVDTFFNRAVKAGAEITMPVSDVFWGDRYGQLKDPFGHSWSVATHTQDLTEEQIAEGARNAFADTPAS